MRSANSGPEPGLSELSGEPIKGQSGDASICHACLGAWIDLRHVHQNDDSNGAG